jgi:uncharacterized protein involved in type VI secretion and phage assembly
MPVLISELDVQRKPVLHEGVARWYGVYVAHVIDIKDPESQGRVKVMLPWAPDADIGRYEVWARVATFFAGNHRGSWFMPDVEDEVLIAFDGGDLHRPFVLGSLWKGGDQTPETMDAAGRNYRKVIRSRNGVQVTLDDQDGQERLVLETPGGQQITLKDGPGSIEVVDSNGSSVKFESSGITLNASAKVTVQASQVAISAGILTIDAGMSKFSGVVQADTVIANSVVSASYTPGAGNIW